MCSSDFAISTTLSPYLQHSVSGYTDQCSFDPKTNRQIYKRCFLLSACYTRTNIVYHVFAMNSEFPASKNRLRCIFVEKFRYRCSFDPVGSSSTPPPPPSTSHPTPLHRDTLSNTVFRSGSRNRNVFFNLWWPLTFEQTQTHTQKLIRFKRPSLQSRECFRKLDFHWFSSQPMGLQDERWWDSTLPHRSTSRGPLCRKLNSHWFPGRPMGFRDEQASDSSSPCIITPPSVVSSHIWFACG